MKWVLYQDIQILHQSWTVRLGQYIWGRELEDRVGSIYLDAGLRLLRSFSRRIKRRRSEKDSVGVAW